MVPECPPTVPECPPTVWEGPGTEFSKTHFFENGIVERSFFGIGIVERICSQCLARLVKVYTSFPIRQNDKGDFVLTFLLNC